MNPDLAKERSNSALDVEKLKLFIGKNLLLSSSRYQKISELKKKLVTRVKPLYHENFEHLERNEKYELMLKKSLELLEFANQEKIDNYMELTYLIGEVLGTEKQLFGLHFTMFTLSIELWSTPEQKEYWQKFISENSVFGTYIQTEIGHGTFVRGLETTATYDKNTQEFIIDSPTLSSIKFWPGASGKTCNFGIVMAKLIIDDKDYGIHAFIVQLRSLEDHKTLPGIEIGDIGKKGGYETIDNGYIKFKRLRIPRMNVLMQFAQVTPEGEFKRVGNEIVMYAVMLLMRGILCMFASLLHSISTTIAVRYSCVRRQTANLEGVEPQIIDYQTQQYRILPGLATTYANFFSTLNFRNIINSFKKRSNFFKNINPSELAKLHAISSGLKSMVFDDLLKFSQLNRLCCGGHGYSAASGLQPIIQEADAGCTYEGDNVVLLLQTARYLLKCAQKGSSPHLEFENLTEIKASNLYKHFEPYFVIFERLYDNAINEVSSRMINLINEQKLSQFDAWNESSVHLINTAKCFINIFVIYSNLIGLYQHSKTESEKNQIILCELFELYLCYGIVDKFSSTILKLEIIDKDEMNNYQTKLFELLKKVRVNALNLVDSFGWSDSNLSSSLGVYDGNVYEKLFQFAKTSPFNQNQVHEAYSKILVPYIHKQKSNL